MNDNFTSVIDFCTRADLSFNARVISHCPVEALCYRGSYHVKISVYGGNLYFAFFVFEKKVKKISQLCSFAPKVKIKT